MLRVYFLIFEIYVFNIIWFLRILFKIVSLTVNILLKWGFWLILISILFVFIFPLFLLIYLNESLVNILFFIYITILIIHEKFLVKVCIIIFLFPTMRIDKNLFNINFTFFSLNFHFKYIMKQTVLILYIQFSIWAYSSWLYFLNIIIINL
jgi:hypothetical protein